MSAAIIDNTTRPLSHLARHELEAEVERLRGLNAQLNSNMGAVQSRCTDLLLEARAMAKVPAVLSDAIREIVRERERQNEKWSRSYGDWPVTDLVKLAVLGEEVGEVSRAILEDSNLREELVQVAAVCCAWLEVLP